MVKSKDPLFDEINAIIQDKFGINRNNSVVNYETLRREVDPESFDRSRASFEAALAISPNKEEILKRTYFGETFAIQLQSVFSRSEIEWIHPKLGVHFPVCTAEEIRKIQRPTTTDDHLLILRADAIANSSRLKRVFLSRREKDIENWSLTAHFERGEFKNYLATLPSDKRIICSKISAGMAFLREPNGSCMRSNEGDFIVVSESLRYYLYYMNAFLFGQEELRVEDRVAALMIAVRTMLLTEALDFDLDPRGDLPSDLHRHASALAENQIQFVIGHEFAHLLLGHLNAKTLGAFPLGVVPFDIQERFKYYSPKQHQEIAADAGALLHCQLDDNEIAERTHAATWFFLGLEIFYAVAACVDAKFLAAKTHPPPVERIWALRRNVANVRALDPEIAYSDEQIEQVIAWIAEKKKELLEYVVPQNIDNFKTYGSVYFPSYRSGKLHDRIDF